MKKLLVLAPLVTSGLLVGAVISDETDRHGPGHQAPALQGGDAHQYVLDTLDARLDGLDFYDVADSYQQFLPNQEFRFEDGTERPLSEGLVYGEVTDVRPAFAYLVHGKDAASGELTAFDDPEARWRILELDVAVSDASGSVEGAVAVQVGLSIDGSTDFESFRNGLLSREIVAPLSRQGFFSGDADLWNISRSDTLLGFVNSDGSVRYPFIESGEWAPPISAERVMDRAEAPREVIDLTTDGGGLLVQEP